MAFPAALVLMALCEGKVRSWSSSSSSSSECCVFVWMNIFPKRLTLLLPRYLFAWMHACRPLGRSYVSSPATSKDRNSIRKYADANVEVCSPLLKVHLCIAVAATNHMLLFKNGNELY